VVGTVSTIGLEPLEMVRGLQSQAENFPKRVLSSQELEGPEVLAGSSAKISGAMATQ